MSSTTRTRLRVSTLCRILLLETCGLLFPLTDPIIPLKGRNHHHTPCWIDVCQVSELFQHQRFRDHSDDRAESLLVPYGAVDRPSFCVSDDPHSCRSLSHLCWFIFARQRNTSFFLMQTPTQWLSFSLGILRRILLQESIWLISTMLTSWKEVVGFSSFASPATRQGAYWILFYSPQNHRNYSHLSREPFLPSFDKHHILNEKFNRRT